MMEQKHRKILDVEIIKRVMLSGMILSLTIKSTQSQSPLVKKYGRRFAQILLRSAGINIQFLN